MTNEPWRPSTSPREVSETEILQRPFSHVDAIPFLQSFYAEQIARYGHADPIDKDTTQYQPPHGIFFVMYQSGSAVGCGGYRWFDRALGIVEVKKTYLLPGGRGRGWGRALFHRLEEHARTNGAHHVVLETGVRKTAALSLFARMGYREIASYVAGRNPAINRAFTKPLTRTAPPLTADALAAAALVTERPVQRGE